MRMCKVCGTYFTNDKCPKCYPSKKTFLDENTIYETLITEGKRWCDPHAIANLRMIKKNAKLFPDFKNEIIWNGFLFIGKMKRRWI